MRRVLAVARQTFWEGIRMRIVLVFIIVLLVVILRLPFAMSGDNTLSGRLQSFLAYSLGALNLFASLAIVFFSCATLANEIKNNQIHLVVTKPISRLEILAGKWLGVNMLSIVLVGICAVMIYAFARHIANRPEQFQRDRLKVRDVVWTARTSAPPKPPGLDPLVEAYIAQRVTQGDFAQNSDEAQAAAAQKTRSLSEEWKLLKPREARIFQFENIPPPEHVNTAIQVKFRARGIPLPPGEKLRIVWQFLDPENNLPIAAPYETTGRSGDLHEFLFTAGAVVKDGKAALLVANPTEEGMFGINVFFEGEESLQLLYKVGSFEANYAKSVVMTLFRLAFLSGVGLMFGVFVSFPVACLCTFVTFLVGMGHDWWMEAIGANIQYYNVDIDPYGRLGPFVRGVLEPLLTLCFPNLIAYDGTSKLIGGEVIPFSLVALSALHTLVFGAALLLLVGWAVFNTREIAEVQV